MPPIILSGFRSSAELAAVIDDALATVDRYPDFGTKAELLLPAVRAAKMLYLRARCCWQHRVSAWFNWTQLRCMRQFFLRVSYRDDGLGTGSTIWFWRRLGRCLSVWSHWFHKESPAWVRPKVHEEGRG